LIDSIFEAKEKSKYISRIMTAFLQKAPFSSWAKNKKGLILFEQPLFIFNENVSF